MNKQRRKEDSSRIMTFEFDEDLTNLEEGKDFFRRFNNEIKPFLDDVSKGYK